MGFEPVALWVSDVVAGVLARSSDSGAFDEPLTSVSLSEERVTGVGSLGCRLLVESVG